MPFIAPPLQVLENLLRQIQRDEDIQGLKHKHYVYKYRVFVNNIMFVAERPEKSLVHLLSKIKECGDLAGLYINRKKSKILCKNVLKKVQIELENTTSCEIVSKVKYLGI